MPLVKLNMHQIKGTDVIRLFEILQSASHAIFKKQMLPFNIYTS